MYRIFSNSVGQHYYSQVDEEAGGNAGISLPNRQAGQDASEGQETKRQVEQYGGKSARSVRGGCQAGQGVQQAVDEQYGP